MLNQKYLIKQNNVISEAYYKKGDIIEDKSNIIDVSKENLIDCFIKSSLIIVLFTVLSQLQLWSFIQSEQDLFIIQAFVQSLLSAVPLFYMFFCFPLSNIKKINVGFNSFKYRDFLFVTLSSATLYLFFFGGLNILYCVANDIPRGNEFLEVFASNHLYFTFFCAVFYLFSFLNIKKQLFNEKDLLCKKEELEKEEEKIDKFIVKEENDIIAYLKDNIKSSKNADYLLLLKEDLQLVNLRDEISIAIEYYANNQGFKNYQELKREELSNQEEIIYNY